MLFLGAICLDGVIHQEWYPTGFAKKGMLCLRTTRVDRRGSQLLHTVDAKKLT